MFGTDMRPKNKQTSQKKTENSQCTFVRWHHHQQATTALQKTPHKCFNIKFMLQHIPRHTITLTQPVLFGIYWYVYKGILENSLLVIENWKVVGSNDPKYVAQSHRTGLVYSERRSLKVPRAAISLLDSYRNQSYVFSNLCLVWTGSECMSQPSQ